VRFKTFIENYFPITVRLILVKALLFFVLYKFVLSFNLNFINTPINSNIGTYSTKLLNYYTNSSEFYVVNEYVYSFMKTKSAQIYHNNRKLVFIADSCNSLVVCLRYISVIFCFPSRFWRKALYIVLGIAIIHLFNIVRCSSLAYINLYYQPYFNSAHNFWLKGLVYGPIALLWLLYLKNITTKPYLPNKEIMTP